MVLAILSVLGGLGWSGLGGLKRWQAVQESRALFLELQTACRSYRVDHGRWPDALADGILRLEEMQTGWADELAPYLERNVWNEQVTDGFGNSSIRIVVDLDGDHWINASDLPDLADHERPDHLWDRVVVFSLDAVGRLAFQSWDNP